MNKTLTKLIKRNIKLFFKDKGMFFVSLITPAILLVLYATFLGNVYRDSFLMAVPEGIVVADSIVNGFVGGQLASSILAVCTVTIAFCSNMLMVQDKAKGALYDLTVSPVSPSTLAIGYYISTLISTLIISYSAAAICFGYMGVMGWYMSTVDVILLLADIFILVMFGTALSSTIGFFLSTEGQISAVGTIISSGYGFICGAYMPISQFSDGLQKIICLLPGTYGTALIRNHCLGGVLREMENEGIPSELLESFRDAFDCNIYFFDTKVSVPVMYTVLISTVLAVIGVYVVLNITLGKKARAK